MKQHILNFLRAAFPFLLTVALWRLATAMWNPAGILALIPVFYCTFVRATPGFAPFALLFCFLVDYKFNVPFVWTVLWCLFYAANGFQTVVDLTRMEFRALYAFMLFFGVGIVILLCMGFSWVALLRAMFVFAWAGVCYLPLTGAIKRIADD